MIRKIPVRDITVIYNIPAGITPFLFNKRSFCLINSVCARKTLFLPEKLCYLF
jgi:hypothetical protein